MKTKIVKYSYCLDEQKNLVHIESLTEETRHYSRFFCVSCGHEMVANLGKIRVKYFSHKKEIGCSVESYLHKLAKYRIREKFCTSTTFPICFKRDVPCSDRDFCPCFIESHCCEKDVTIPFDLKAWNGNPLYDSCKEEMKVDEFRPDLLLTSSMYPNRKPIFIEVYKTHKSEETKVNSEYRIIETLRIQSENDIDDIIERGFIEGENCTFHNFTPTLPKKRKKDIPIERFILYRNGSAFVVRSMDYSLYCDSIYKKSNASSEAELNINDPWGYKESSLGLNSIQLGLVYLLKKGRDIKNCILCRYYRYNDRYEKNICILYKKLNKQSPYPRQIDAKTCVQYELNQELMRYSLSEVEREVSEVPNN